MFNNVNHMDKKFILECYERDTKLFENEIAELKGKLELHQCRIEMLKEHFDDDLETIKSVSIIQAEFLQETLNDFGDHVIEHDDFERHAREVLAHLRNKIK